MNPGLSGLAVALLALLFVRGFLMARDADAPDRLGFEIDDRRVSGKGPTARLLDRLGRSFGPSFLRAIGDRQRQRINDKIIQAGRPDGMTVESFAQQKAALLVVAIPVAFLFFAVGAGLIALPTLFYAWFVPDMSLARQARRRQEQIERDLPDFLDILAVTVRAGIGYRAALGRVGEGLGGPMGDEVAVTLREMELGATRREALSALKLRNSAEAVQKFVTAQLQAEELGVPLAQALNEIARDMRNHAHQNAKQRAQRAAPRVSLIITSLIVPASIILVFVAMFLQADLKGMSFG